MLIRNSTQGDYEALIAIGHKFFEFNPYRNHSSLDEMSLLRTFHQLASHHVLLVAEYEGRIIGTAGAFIAPVYWNNDDLQGLEAFWWIDEEYRSAGVGKLLRQALQNEAQRKGAKFWNMIALTESHHDMVCKSYEKAGMTHVETVYMKVL